MRVHQVAFLACGWALASAETHGTSVALGTDEGTVLVDGGGGVAKGLVNTLGLQELAHIYLTHEHADHTWGLPGLLHCLRFAGERGDLHVHGPAPALARVHASLDALGVTTPFEIVWHELEDQAGGDDRARWVPADHAVPCLSYRFDDVVICGDTRPTDATVELARGASLLVHEASHTDEELTHRSGHSTPADAGAIAARAEVDLLAAIHVHPSLSRQEAAQATGFTPTIAPKDGDVLSRDGSTWSL